MPAFENKGNSGGGRRPLRALVMTPAAIRAVRSFGSRQKARMSQQGVAAAIVEYLAGLEEFVADQQVRKCGDVFGTRDPAERREIDEALLERIRILSKLRIPWRDNSVGTNEGMMPLMRNRLWRYSSAAP